MLKTDFFKRLGVLSLSAPLVAQAAVRADAQDDADALIGLWEAVVTVQGGSFRYIYSMSRGAYVATGNIDENFTNSEDKFHGPGTFTQFDLHSKAVASEKFTLTAKRFPV
jgi:hypothetical protein